MMLDEYTLDDLLQLEEGAPERTVYCLCGSTDKAEQAFKDECLRLTLEGHIVLSIGANAKDRDLCITLEQKVELDLLHLAKIRMSHIVRILNVGDYIGRSTRREEEYAYRLGKRVEYLEPVVYKKEA